MKEFFQFSSDSAWSCLMTVMEKEMTTHFSVLTGIISWTEEPGSLVNEVTESQMRLSTAAAAKWLHSCPTLYNPIDGSPPGSPIPGILQARTLEWVAISFSNA